MPRTEIHLNPIGIIHTPHTKLDEIPIQPVFCEGIEGEVVLDPQYAEGLEGIEAFSHIYLFFHFHAAKKTSLRTIPYLSDEEMGVFATRSPSRPNKIGLSLVRLIGVENNIIKVSDIDIMNGTPLLDVKPYVQRFDSRESAHSGWQDQISEESVKARSKRNFRK